MSPRAVRRIVIAVCVAGIGGMIAGSIADNNGAAMTAGLVTAVAILCLIVATAVTTSPPGAGAGAEGAAVEVEDAVEALVAGGADEAEVRELVRRAVRLGRAQ
jgi:multisubunit Na+/H+ antiporter MnhB subunit